MANNGPQPSQPCSDCGELSKPLRRGRCDRCRKLVERRASGIRPPLGHAGRKRRAREYVRPIREATVCVRCGAQPIDWHRKEHEDHPGRRVSALVNNGHPPKTIAAEIALCTALCRRCHMSEDGRLESLISARRKRLGAAVPVALQGGAA